MTVIGANISETIGVVLVQAPPPPPAPPEPGPLDMHNLALAFLDLVADALETLPVFDSTLEGAPERQFVSPGMPVDDFVGKDCCSAIGVYVTPITEDGTTPGGLDAGRRAARFARINSVSLVARVTRCIPTGDSGMSGIYTPPSDEALTESARQHDADGWALWNYLFDAVHAEELLTICDEVFFDGITALIPSGGCAGWQVSVRATLGGYQTAIGS